MNFLETNQYIVFLYSLIFGLGIGLYYELYRVIKIFIFKTDVSTFVFDLIFTVSSAVFSFIFFIAYTCGEIRLFLLIGILVGSIIFRFTIGKITTLIYKQLYKIIKLIFSCVYSFYLIIFIPFLSIFKVFVTFLKNIFKKRRKHLES